MGPRRSPHWNYIAWKWGHTLGFKGAGATSKNNKTFRPMSGLGDIGLTILFFLVKLIFYMFNKGAHPNPRLMD
jgi:hypothetical protein